MSSQPEHLDVNELLQHVQKLPSLPSLVADILESFEREEMDVKTLASKIARDQAIVARVLRVANSPFFGLSGKIGSISEAIAVLGFNNLRGLVTGAAIINAFPRGDENLFDWRQFWCHSINAAVTAKVLAKRLGINAETAFTAGLLHDIGKLVIGVYFPKMFAGSLHFAESSDENSLQAERQLLGMDHARLGGEIAQRWRFPPPIQQALALHHDAQRLPERGLTDVIYAANLLAHARDGEHIHTGQTAAMTQVLVSRLGLNEGALDEVAQEAQQLYAGAVTLIGD